ncbi:uncharacterized protein LOC121058657 [Cygnus olor]|uniref:uncharacterized protein LOC121058657 n=1 Tax=Cygnus olor TaxID=8869 RepID=UPI001ADE8AB1|nr:uncharacterized protein LOC121058657 [Cygnus olor]
MNRTPKFPTSHPKGPTQKVCTELGFPLAGNMPCSFALLRFKSPPGTRCLLGAWCSRDQKSQWKGEEPAEDAWERAPRFTAGRDTPPSYLAGLSFLLPQTKVHPSKQSEQREQDNAAVPHGRLCHPRSSKRLIPKPEKIHGVQPGLGCSEGRHAGPKAPISCLEVWGLNITSLQRGLGGGPGGSLGFCQSQSELPCEQCPHPKCTCSPKPSLGARCPGDTAEPHESEPQLVGGLSCPDPAAVCHPKPRLLSAQQGETRPAALSRAWRRLCHPSCQNPSPPCSPPGCPGYSCAAGGQESAQMARSCLRGAPRTKTPTLLIGGGTSEGPHPQTGLRLPNPPAGFLQADPSSPKPSRTASPQAAGTGVVPQASS